MPQSVDLAPAPRKMQQGLLGVKTGKNHKNTWGEGCEDAPVLARRVPGERGGVGGSNVRLEPVLQQVKLLTKPGGIF